MKHIVVAIEPHEDGVRCIGCESITVDPYYCKMSEWYQSCGYGEYRRGPACLAAEAKLTALIEAGQSVADEIILQEPDWSVTDAWDRAVAEVRK